VGIAAWPPAPAAVFASMGGRGVPSSGGPPLSRKVETSFIETSGQHVGPSEPEEGEEDELGQYPCMGLRVRQVSEPVMLASSVRRQVSGRGSGSHVSFIREELEEPEEERPEPETEREPCWLLAQDGKPARQESDNLSGVGSPTTHVATGNGFTRQETEMNWPSWGDANPDEHAGGRTVEHDHLSNWNMFTQMSDEQTPLAPGDCGTIPASLGSSGTWQNAMATTAVQASFGFDASLASAAMAAMQDSRAGGADAGAGPGIPSPEWANVYTVMMRNLPNKYTQHMLLEELNKSGFLGTFDFLYLPIDPDTNANRGYAFINFISPGSAWMLRMTYEGRKMSRFNSDKVVSVSPAALQGFEANYAHYSTARVSRGDPALRPLFLRESDIKGTLLKSGPGRRRGGRRSAGSLIDVAARQHQTRQHQQARPVAVASAKAPTAPGSAVYFGLNTGKQSNLVAKFCPYCGGACQPEHKFCKFCGASLAFQSRQD